MKNSKNSKKVKSFAGINFRGWQILKNFAEKAKKRKTTKVSDLKVLWQWQKMTVTKLDIITHDNLKERKGKERKGHIYSLLIMYNDGLYTR